MKKAITPLCLLSCMFLGISLNVFMIDYFYIDNFEDQVLCTIMCAAISAFVASINVKNIPE